MNYFQNSMTNTNSRINNKYVIGYSPNNFFYVNGNQYMPDFNYTKDCANDNSIWKTTASDCSNNFIDNSMNCINQSLCNNKSYAQQLQKIQSTHNGTDELLLDINSDYTINILTSLNLSIGIIILSFIIYKYSHDL
jgi:hypothetical protein